MIARSRLPRRMLLASLVFVGGASTAPADTGGVWRTVAPLQTARQELGAAAIGGSVYVVGGLLRDPNIQATATVERYDVASDTWSSVAPLPAPRDHAGVCALGGQLYVIGGFAGDFWARNNVWRYDPGVNAWTPRAPLPSPRGACWAVAHGSKVYVFGGVAPGGAATSTTFVYDPAVNAWQTGASMPTAREHLTAASLGSFIYVVGGRASGALSVNERYDPATDTWATLAPMPTARSATGTAALDGRLFVMGGEVPMLFDVNEVYDPGTDAWTAQAPMAVPRHGIAAVPLTDGIFVAGGGRIQGLLPTARADVFTPLSNQALHACFCASGAPCGNTASESGCRNSTGSGAGLTATGTASVSSDTLALVGSGMPVGSSAVYFQGTDPVNGGAGAPFGDGLRCAGGTVVRLGTKTNTDGTSRYPEAGDAPVSVRGLVPVGATRRYQTWCRDPSGPCGSGFNLTNAVVVTWVN